MTRPMNSVLRPYARAMNPRRSLLILVGAVAAFVVAASLDYVENLSHLYLIDHRDAIAPLAIMLTGGVSWLKWALALGVLGFLIWRLPRALFRSRVGATP